MSAADWKALSDWRPPEFTAEVFDVAAKATKAANAAIRNGLPAIEPPSWSTGWEALAAHFGIDLETSCFNALPHEWADFLEPQITKGFVHFLSVGPHTCRMGRCVAFVRAAQTCAGKPDLSDQCQPRFVEAIAEEERVDILVELEGPKGTFGAVVEAKFWHGLTKDQLEKARQHVIQMRRWSQQQSAFLVIAPQPVARDHRHMAEGWQPVSWWSFLRSFDRLIDAEDDCPDFRRFRRTIWHKAY